jgi:phosphoribosyl 1,2-cyclic phosphate phosphodiesterase
MRLIFLGTGTSAGVPAIGCDCGVCTSADPRDQRLRTSAAVVWNDASGQERCVLLDAGPDLRQQSLRNRLRRLDAVFFTHNHVDHTFGLDEVRRFNVVQRAPIDVYAEAHTMEHLRRVYRHIFEKENNVNDSFVATLIPHTIDAERPVELFGVRFTPVRLLHGRLPVLGYRIEEIAPKRNGAGGSLAGARGSDEAADRMNSESGAGVVSGPLAGARGSDGARGQDGGDESPFPLAYCTDVSAIPPESYRKLTGLRTLVLDALRHRKHPTHFTLEEAVRVADQVGAGRTYFVHMAHDLGHKETQDALPDGMHLAWDGLVLAARAGVADE